MRFVLGLAKRYIFILFSRFIPAELMMAALYLYMWVINGYDEGLQFGLLMEFVVAHAHGFTALSATMFPTSTLRGKGIMALVSFVYLLFVIGVAFAQNNILAVFSFVILSIKRITQPVGEVNMANEIFYGVLKVGIFLVTGFIGFILHAVVSDSDISETKKLEDIAPICCFIYFMALFVFEYRVAPKFLKLRMDKNFIQRKISK